MSKYCCFFCPEKNYAEKVLDDTCPNCGRTYGFVLSNCPERIRDYRITKDLGRGFYGAAYIAERGTFNRKYVLKISPVQFYSFFSKTPFEEETDMHAKLAENAAHIAGIDDRFDEDIEFPDDQRSTLRCHVTVLDYVDGSLLRDYIDGKISISSAAVCQIAIDLLRIRAEFEANKLNHNDLHAENLIVERLRPEARRPDAVDDTIRVKAIDLGSISDASKSSEDREGDLYFIAKHVDQLLNLLLSCPTALEDRDFRTALALQSIVHGMLANAQNVRHPNLNDLVEQIKEAYYRAAHHWRPWSNPLSLKGFGDHYNAQTLESWNVPRLLVDPDNRWLAEVTKPGPQIITGMRGCGKTMLLRALDIHARASQNNLENEKEIIKRLSEDQFVGLFVSAQRLLDLRHTLYKLEHRLTRLFVNYSLQAARALLHLKDIDATLLAPDAHIKLANAISDYLEGSEDLREPVSIEDLERRLERIVVLTSRGPENFSVKQSPVEVFTHLADQLRACSHIFSNASIFFLLDDVSTRYLELERIDELLSALLFQSPFCAFKFTSEWQTIELGLQSPGRNHPIRVDRDLAVFDLGADVFQTINASGKSKGSDFVAQILQQRAKFHVSHPVKFMPKDLLGDVSLEQVAREIAASNSTSKQRKEAYRGLSCLTSVCVGDIGDIIKLYEEILKRASADKSQIPISKDIQSDCFQEMSSRRLYDLNRRNSYFKNHALAFAQAAHELLVRSYRQGVKKQKELPRLRQYSSIYVRVTSDDEKSRKQQIDGLRELIDAGVFVYAGGSSPRTKTKDSNPIQQFKISYRKIYGLAAFIGLADRDRFELSGHDLREWLENPANAKEILLRNQINDEIEARNATGHSLSNADFSIPEDDEVPQHTTMPQQQSIFESDFAVDFNDEPMLRPKIRAKQIDVEIEKISRKSLANMEIGGILTGLGFEDRTLASNRLLSTISQPNIVHAVKYPVQGHATEIIKEWRNASRNIVEIDYKKALVELPKIDGLALIDITGLSKPLIFAAIRRELIDKKRVLVCHVSAERHYPLQEDLGPLFAAKEAEDPLLFLESLASVLKGETGPYRELRLLEEQVDPSRSRALLAFASAKHERLFSLLDKREFDYIKVIAPTGDEPRSKVALYAAEFLCQNYQNAKFNRIDTNDLVSLLKYMDEQFLDVYGSGGANLEIGLTGSKIQAVASAILSARRKVAQAWYLSPKQFDEKRFSTGTGDVRFFDIYIAENK